MFWNKLQEMTTLPTSSKLNFKRESEPRPLSFEELLAMGSKFPVVVLLGHGADGQIKDLCSAVATLNAWIDKLDSHYGVENYLFVFGGDPCDEDEPDVGSLVAQISHRVILIATQHQIIDEWGGFADQGWGDRHPDGMSQLAGYTLFETSRHVNGDICWSGLKCDKKNGTPMEPLQPGGMVEFILDMRAEGG